MAAGWRLDGRRIYKVKGKRKSKKKTYRSRAGAKKAAKR